MHVSKGIQLFESVKLTVFNQLCINYNYNYSMHSYACNLCYGLAYLSAVTLNLDS